MKNAKELCLQLVRIDDEQEVLNTLVRNDLDDIKLWRPLGDIENNLSIAGNQQSNPTAAQVEKIVNSIDSTLILKCLLAGKDPESKAAPQSMTDASKELFQIPDGNVAKLSRTERSKLAELIQLVATGDRKEPSFTFVDQGEGQRPVDFPNTFCSLVKSNKLRIPFVQGKFNMGGCGVLPFCGKENMQLIVSKRHPTLTKGDKGTEKTGWGWTIVRRRDPDKGRRSSYYEYLAPDGQVPCFDADELPLLASKDEAYANPMRWGSLIKVYNYQTEFPSAVVFDLSFELSRRLYRLPIPVRLYERRDYRGHSKGTILTGMSVRIADDHAGVIESGFPDSGIISVNEIGDVPVQVTVFKKKKSENYVSKNAAILFLVNGQVHGSLSNRFCSRKQVNLEYIKNDIMIVLDCSSIPPRVREDLFMPSRDRLRNCSAKSAFENSLEDYLSEHEELAALNLRRREDELKGRLADDKPLSEALKNVINSSPELKDLFQFGTTVPTSDVAGDEKDEYEGLKFPTYFKTKKEFADGERIQIPCEKGKRCKLPFLTDAENEYFNRDDQPGTISISNQDIFEKIRLHNGRSTLTLSCPPKAKVDDEFEFEFEVTDPNRTEPFSFQCTLLAIEEKETADSDSDSDPPSSGALALPKVVEICEADWEEVGFDAESGLTLQNDIDGGLLAKVNIDNCHLHSSLAKRSPSDHDMIRKQFVYGLVLVAVSLWQEYSEHDERDDLIRTATKAHARVILPSISVLGALGVHVSN